MKRLIILMLVGLSGIFTAQAEPITREQAQQKAERYLQGRTGSRKLAPVVSSRKLAPRRGAAAASPETYYAFNRGESEGFVLVAADDRIEPVLGYTDDGEFDYNAIPDNMRTWLDAQERYVRYLQEHPDYATATVPVHDAIPEMLTTRWNQGAPYNDLTPRKSNGAATATGCVATAMAQVLYFQRSKSVEELQATIPAYTTGTQQLAVESIPEGSPIDWDNMLDTYGGSATGLQKQAVAQLMKYCGAAVHMDYDDSSGAQPGEVPGAINTYFGYTTARIVWQSNYNEVSWDALLYNELANGRVAYLGGYNPNAGHAFVCDGYDGNHCFHINWGWGGSSNGWFLLTALTPGQQGIGGSEDGSGYTDGQNAVIGCEPTDYRNKELPIANATVKKLCLENWDTDGNGKFTYGEAAAVTDLGTVFKGAAITTFAELYYFTGLTTIGASAFEGCTRLNTVKFPKKLTVIGDNAFSGCTALKTLTLPNGITTLGDNAFKGCRLLPNLEFPDGVTAIGSNAFNGCTTFTALTFPNALQEIGAGAFGGCTKVTSITVTTPSPQDMTVGADIFRNESGAGPDYEKTMLYIPQGTRSFLSQTEPWKNFSNIIEQRDIAHGRFGTLEINKDFFIYNVATGRYLSKGEAYGTQSIVSEEPMRYQFKRSASMAAGTYYLTSSDTGKTGTLLFRTWSDGNVGSGIAACFVDGTLSSNGTNAYWTVTEVRDGIYTLQTAPTQSHYDAALYLGVDPNHDSGAATPTYGAYSDVSYADHQRGCEWRLVPYDADDYNLYLASQQLEKLLAKAKTAKAKMEAEQAVYDNTESSIDEVNEACYKLRQKLNLINFADATVRSICLAQWDADMDGELSLAEAAKVTDFGVAFQNNTKITSLEDLQYFTSVTEIAANTFQKCTSVTTVTLPPALTTINNYAFNQCTKLTSIILPENVRYIGTGAFTVCPALTEVTVAAAKPSDIRVVNTIFSSSYLSKATLYVPFGTKELYADATPWKAFGEIKEVRTHLKAGFSPVEVNVQGYLYNLGTQRYAARGEAYGTQAVAAESGLVYQFKKTSRENVYGLASTESKPYLFRTSSDSKIGTGVKGCFADAESLTSAGYWHLMPAEGAEENVFTLQVPETDATYTEGEYLGVQTNHASDFTSPTYGLYWDVSLASVGENCHWAFIRKADVDAMNAFNALGDELKALLAKADARAIDVTAERAVYDTPTATADDLQTAIDAVQEKLGFIVFADERARQQCINEWDTNHDGYFSLEEAAAVTDLGQIFYSVSSMKSIDELRYFTGIQEIPENAFRGSTALMSLYIPAGVKTIGANAFTSCSSLRYMAVLSETVPDASAVTLSKSITAFVPAAMTEAYAAAAKWNALTLEEYTGVPTVTSTDASREYGRSTSSFKYLVSGAPINGVPTQSCDVTTTTPAGDYPIVIQPGTITSRGLVCQNGTLTIAKAPVTVTALSYTRKMGEPNPEFEVKYSALRNRETIEVFNTLPTVTCEATPDSPYGDYEIVVSGAEADNYEFTYVNGTLTIEPPVGIAGVKADGTPETIYNLAGQRVSTLRRGVNIVGSPSAGKKLYVK